MKARLSVWWDTISNSFWFIPTLLSFGAALVAVGLLRLDENTNTRDYVEMFPFLYTGGTQGTRGLLGAIGSSMITVAGTTFSITIAALTLASSNYGPRLLGNFMRDRGNQFVLGVFVATFLYCLVVLRSVRDLESQSFVPHLATTFAIFLAVLSVGVLIYFIHHITSLLQVSSLVEEVRRELGCTVERMFPEPLGQDASEMSQLVEDREWRERIDFEGDGEIVESLSSGYVQAVDDDALMSVAVRHDLVLNLIHRPGHFVVGGNTMMQAWPRARVTPEAKAALQKAWTLGSRRTLTQDVEFGLLQITEVAVRALSPGINDPFTAVNALHQASVVLCQLALRQFPSSMRFDESGARRVIAPVQGFDELLDVALSEIRSNGAQFLLVLETTLEVIAEVSSRAWRLTDLEALRHQAQLTRRASDQLVTEEARERLEAAARHTLDRIMARERTLRKAEERRALAAAGNN